MSARCCAPWEEPAGGAQGHGVDPVPGRLAHQATYTEALGRRLLAVVADLCQLAGWVASDASMAGTAERYYSAGINAAHAADDPALAANLISLLSYVYSNTGRRDDAVPATLLSYWTRRPASCSAARSPACTPTTNGSRGGLSLSCRWHKPERPEAILHNLPGRPPDPCVEPCTTVARSRLDGRVRDRSAPPASIGAVMTEGRGSVSPGVRDAVDASGPGPSPAPSRSPQTGVGPRGGCSASPLGYREGILRSWSGGACRPGGALLHPCRTRRRRVPEWKLIPH
jgi:hypothetical protein